MHIRFIIASLHFFFPLFLSSERASERTKCFAALKTEHMTFNVYQWIVVKMVFISYYSCFQCSRCHRLCQSEHDKMFNAAAFNRINYTYKRTTLTCRTTTVHTTQHRAHADLCVSRRTVERKPSQ